jgi:hypothetical protein
VDIHAMDLVGINDITQVLLAYTCQQGVYPRSHILPLRLPNTVPLCVEFCSFVQCNILVNHLTLYLSVFPPFMTMNQLVQNYYSTRMNTIEISAGNVGS